jgi:autotransporter adhesin
MRTQKKCTRSSHSRITTIAIAVASSFAMTPAWAAPATNLPGNGVGIAIGSGSNAPKAENVAIGKDATIAYSGGVGQPSTGDIVIGGGAHTNNYIDQGGGIAIGSNSFVENMVGGLERAFDFNQAGYEKDPDSGISHGFPKDPTKMVTGIAIGQNTYTRSGSVMLGTHNYKGKLGDVDVDSSSTKDNNMLLFSTTLGANSYSNGLFSTVTGAYSIASSGYSGGSNSVLKNFGATITGSLNSIESATASSLYSGVANSIVGVANRTFNSNGSLIFGAGNEITNSLTSIAAPLSGGGSAKDLADALRSAVKESNGGGATLAIGGGNTADYTQASQLIGVNNTLKGSSSSISQYNALNGYKNTASNVNHVTVIGSENSVSDTTTAVVFGDKRTLNGADNSVIIGSSSDGTTTSVKNAVAIGTESNATVEGGVALGAGSVASTDKGKVGYDPGTKAASTNTDSTWVSTRAAVSIGDTANGITRQITGLAAGTADTDAVNVAQLKVVKGDASQAVTESKKHSSVVAGNNIKVTSQANAEGGTEYSVSTADNVSFSSVAVGAASISQAGIQAGSQKITNVAPGTISATSTDAVNGSQLYQTNQAVQQNSDDISKLYNRSAELNRKIHRAGAHAAALAALHPLDFDENHRVSASLGLGQYHSSGAAALGIFVRPTENFMVSLGGSIASGSDLMGNLGVHYRFGGDSVRVNKTELTQQVSTLTAENRDLSAKLASSNSKLEAATSKIDSLMERIHAIEAKLNMK